MNPLSFLLVQGKKTSNLQQEQMYFDIKLGEGQAAPEGFQERVSSTGRRTAVRNPAGVGDTSSEAIDPGTPAPAPAPAAAPTRAPRRGSIRRTPAQQAAAARRAARRNLLPRGSSSGQANTAPQ